MIFAALAEAADKNELLLVQDGMCRWHRRKDGVVVIREIVVLPFRRRTGVGWKMVQEVRSRNPGCVVRAVCPKKYEANKFWERLYFTRTDDDSGDNCTWELPPALSTAPMATPSLPVPQ